MEENGFFLFMSRIGDIVFLNLCFLLTCIPVVTAGTALISLYTVTLKMAQNQEGYVIKSYFKAFKDNLKQGIIVGVVLELILAVLGYDAWMLLSSRESYSAAGFFVTAALSAAAILSAAVIGIVRPVSDVYYYAGGLLALGAVLFNMIEIIRNYNRLAMRRLPQFDKKEVA